MTETPTFYTPFQPKLEEEKDKDVLIVSMKLNKEEQEILKQAKALLRQPKDSTALKQLMRIGFKSITHPETQALLDFIFENERRNKRLGIPETEYKD